MLTINECKKYLSKYDLQDDQIEEIRNILYCICENVINNHIDNAQGGIEKTIKGK